MFLILNEVRTLLAKPAIKKITEDPDILIYSALRSQELAVDDKYLIT